MKGSLLAKSAVKLALCDSVLFSRGSALFCNEFLMKFGSVGCRVMWLSNAPGFGPQLMLTCLLGPGL